MRQDGGQGERARRQRRGQLFVRRHPPDGDAGQGYQPSQRQHAEPALLNRHIQPQIVRVYAVADVDEQAVAGVEQRETAQSRAHQRIIRRQREAAPVKVEAAEGAVRAGERGQQATPGGRAEQEKRQGQAGAEAKAAQHEPATGE